MVSPEGSPKEREIKEEEKIVRPIVESFKVEAKRMKEIKEIINILSPLGFVDFIETRDSLVLVNVERRDILKNPYLFSIIYLNPKDIEVVYSYAPDVSPKKRRLDVLRYVLNVATLLEDVYFINHKQVYQVVDGIMSRLVEYTASSYDEIFSKYDSLKEEVERLRKRSEELTDANANLTKASIEYKAAIDKLTLRVRELETYTDDVLILKIQDWLREHRYEINISEFAKVNKVSLARVEGILNKMIREGLIIMRG